MKRDIKDVLNAKGIDPTCTICGYDIARSATVTQRDEIYAIIKCSKCHHIMWFDKKALGLD